MEIFSLKYNTFLQQIATTSLKKHSQISQINKAFQALNAAGCWDLCSSFLSQMTTAESQMTMNPDLMEH